MRQPSVFSPVPPTKNKGELYRKGAGNNGGVVPKLDMSPVRKGGKLMGKLRGEIERGKFEEGLDDDDLKFFS